MPLATDGKGVRRMYRIAIVEDEHESAEQLQTMIQRYAAESGEQVEIVAYENAVVFLTNYKASFDLIFMDIEMPHINGMEGAVQLRQIDQNTLLIFATKMGPMAPQGYEVEAFDFIIKPIHYDSLKLKLKRAFARIDQEKEDKISFLSRGTWFYMKAAEIRYVEVLDHQLIYHTESGDHPVYGTMSKLSGQLEPLGFFQCNNCYLVNLRHVQRIQNHVAVLPGVTLQISRPRRKAFMEALNNYIGG